MSRLMLVWMTHGLSPQILIISRAVYRRMSGEDQISRLCSDRQMPGSCGTKRVYKEYAAGTTRMVSLIECGHYSTDPDHLNA